MAVLRRTRMIIIGIQLHSFCAAGKAICFLRGLRELLFKLFFPLQALCVVPPAPQLTFP
jgi:hypothetical protein